MPALIGFLIPNNERQEVIVVRSDDEPTPKRADEPMNKFKGSFDEKHESKRLVNLPLEAQEKRKPY